MDIIYHDTSVNASRYAVFIQFIVKTIRTSYRDEGPAWHKAKSGTPAMGGVVFLSAASRLIDLVYFTGQWHSEVWLLVGTMIFFGGIGFADDFLRFSRNKMKV